MQHHIRTFTWFMIMLGFTSIIYFFSLPAHFPFALTVALVAVFGVASFIWFRRNIPVVADRLATTDARRAHILLFTGLAVLVYTGYGEQRQYGHWDAWWLWDHHAKYLQDSAYWRELLRLDDAYHPDYPLYVSSLIAFIWRLLGSFHMLVPYSFSAFVALVFPCALFLSLYTRNLVIATVAYFLLVFNAVYVRQAFSFYADQPLGLLLLCAIICLEAAKDSRQLTVVVGALLGCCIWMKNEGLMLALVFVAFNAKTLLAGGKAERFFAGIALPLAAYAFLKLNAPGNDLLKGQGTGTLSRLMDVSRYRLVAGYLGQQFTTSLSGVTISMLVYGAYCFAAGRHPGRNILMLATCVLGFCFIYILTPHDLVWHLNTSLDRVLFQLVPSFIYVMARNMSAVRLSVIREEFQ